MFLAFSFLKRLNKPRFENLSFHGCFHLGSKPVTDHCALLNRMLSNVKRCHPQQQPPVIYDLAQKLPSLRDVQLSYEKLRELCMPCKCSAIYW